MKFRSLTQTTDFVSNRNINQLMLLYFDKCHVTYNTMHFNLIFTYIYTHILLTLLTKYMSTRRGCPFEGCAV